MYKYDLTISGLSIRPGRLALWISLWKLIVIQRRRNLLVERLRSKSSEAAIKMNGTNVSWAPAGPLVKYYIPQPLYYIIGTGLLFVFIFGSFMNFTGLMVFVKNKNLRSPTNTFIINLLLGDFGISICTFISMTAHYNRFYFWGDNVCTFEGFWMYFMGLTNMFTIMGISFDRYIVISKPLQASKITTRVAVAACLVIWFQGFCWAAFPFLGWGRYTYEAGRTSCSVQWDTNDIASASYNIAIFVWSLFLPLMLIFYAYYHVFMTVSKIPILTLFVVEPKKVKLFRHFFY